MTQMAATSKTDANTTRHSFFLLVLEDQDFCNKSLMRLIASHRKVANNVGSIYM